MRRSLGLAVFSGMLGVTLFGIFLTPVFFSVIQWLGGRRGIGPSPAPATAIISSVARLAPEPGSR
jgi:multidrug efflux pump